MFKIDLQLSNYLLLQNDKLEMVKLQLELEKLMEHDEVSENFGDWPQLHIDAEVRWQNLVSQKSEMFRRGKQLSMAIKMFRITI